MNEDIDYSIILPKDDKLTSIPLDMINRIAAGLEDPYDVASSYGYTRSQLDKLSQFPPFAQAIDQKRREFDESGITYKNKMKLFAENMADDLYQLAASPEASARTKLDALEYFTKAADLIPKQKQTAEDGPKFVVNINIPDIGNANVVATTLEHEELDFDPADFELLPTTESSSVSDEREVHRSSDRASGQHEDDSGDCEDSVPRSEDEGL